MKKVDYKKRIDSVNSERYEILEYPTSSKDFVVFKVDDDIIKQRADHFIEGYEPRKIANKKVTDAERNTLEYIKNKLQNTDYEILNLNEYKNTGTSNLKFYNKKCGHSFYRSLGNFYKNKKCPICYKENHHVVRAKTTEKFKEDVKSIFGDEYSVLGTYVNSRTPIKLKHLKCGTEFEVPAGRFLREKGFKCPKCSGRSIGEYYIQKYLTEHNISFIHEYCLPELTLEKMLQIDFYLKDYNLFIEYDGEHHFGKSEFLNYNTDVSKVRQSDKLKNQFAKNSGFKMLRIPYWEFSNLKFILDSFFEDPQITIQKFVNKMKKNNIHLNKSYYINITKKIA